MFFNYPDAFFQIIRLAVNNKIEHICRVVAITETSPGRNGDKQNGDTSKGDSHNVKRGTML